MEFYGWIALFVVVAIIIRSIVKGYMEGHMDKNSAGNSPETPHKGAPAKPETAPVPQSDHPRDARRSPLDMPIGRYLVYLLLGGAAIYICLWGYGCADAANDVSHGLDMLTYRMKLTNMNLISRQGYEYYLKNYTDKPQRQREIQQKAEKLDKLFNP